MVEAERIELSCFPPLSVVYDYLYILEAFGQKVKNFFGCSWPLFPSHALSWTFHSLDGFDRDLLARIRADYGYVDTP